MKLKIVMKKENIKNWLLKTRQLACILIIFTNVKGQQVANYITNGGFEQVYSCTGFDQSINNSKGWRSIDSSILGPLMLNTICYSSVPHNGLTFQWPHNGNNHVQTSFLCQPPQCNPTSNRGYFRNRLKSNLINGKSYCVKAYVNVSNPSSYGISNIGFFFVNNSIDTITKFKIPLTYITPQVENPTSNILTDTLNWVPITGTFVANGTEKHCVIGNFKSDAATTKTLINSSSLPTIGCDILIDDVSCIPIDLPAYAGPDIFGIPGNTVYLGRPQDVGIDEACLWYNLTNTTIPIANAAGFTSTVAATTQSYMVKQDICGVIKYDTVVVYASAVGLENVSSSEVENGIRVYPNPANSVINVEVSTSLDLTLKIKLELINTLGQVIHSELATTKNLTLKTKNFNNGVYTLLIKTEIGTLSRKVVIER